MSHNRPWSLLALIGLLFLGACQSAPTSTTTPTVAPTIPLATEQPATPTVPLLSSTEVPTVPDATPTPIQTPLPAPPLPEGGQGNADVVFVRAVQTAMDSGQGTTWTFHVTVEHPDSGWEDYADGWDVLTPDGTVLKPDPESPFTRLLLHPHENEQPFTRSQSGIVVAPGVTWVRVRAHDLVDGYGGREVVVDLTAPTGEDFEVETLR